jgi:hypothetical protein
LKTNDRINAGFESRPACVWSSGFGLFTLAWPDIDDWLQLRSIWNAQDGRVLVYAATAAQIFGGASFTLEQAMYLDATAHLVPKWLPPSQMFWAVTTTVAFALAAVALLTNRMARLATRLLTMMIVIFGLLVWVPLLLSDPHNHANWSETAETFAIAGAAWILADLLGEYR